jgi:hypothetical protein
MVDGRRSRELTRLYAGLFVRGDSATRSEETPAAAAATLPQLTRDPQEFLDFLNGKAAGKATPQQCYAEKVGPNNDADVAELADALDLGSSARKGVRVQVSPSAPMSSTSALFV